MKRFLSFLISIILCISLVGCDTAKEKTQVVATTLPVYEFTHALCNGTGIGVKQLITESVSCLHDYTLQVSQMRDLEDCEMVVLSGAGFEDFLDEKLLMDNKLCINRAHLCAFAHGEYYKLGERIGKFGFSVKKKKSR